MYWRDAFDLVDELVEPDYEWRAVGVFRRKTDDKLFWSTDSGCSCYGPWESHTEADMEPFDWDSLTEFRSAAMGIGQIGATEAHDFVAQMAKLVN